MTDRLRSANSAGYPPNPQVKMEPDLGPRKTLIVLVIVVGCFAVLWPKVFYPMLVGSANQHIKPNPSIDKSSGCCDVISETDVNTIKLMSELCGTIIKTGPDDRPLSPKELIQRCREEVLQTCGIDISEVLQEQVRLGQSVKQILDEIRSLNGSLCLKYHFGVAPWRLGVPHRVMVKVAESNIRQERPLHLGSDMVHPAFRERGRAIPQPNIDVVPKPAPRIIEGRPAIPGLRPTIGGPGHVVPPPKQGGSSMSIIMPIYTIGIVIFFTYTLMKIIFKKQPEGVGGALYPSVESDAHFRREVFESEKSRLAPRLSRDNISSKLVVNAMSALLDEVDQEMEVRRKTSEVATQDLSNGSLSNGAAHKTQENTEEQPTVKVLGMETTESCEGGKKWSRPDSAVLPTSPPPPVEPVPPPQEIYLEGALPAQSHLLVSDSATESQPGAEGEDPAVVLAGKMTLSVISLDASDSGDQKSELAQDLIEECGKYVDEQLKTLEPEVIPSEPIKCQIEIDTPSHETVAVEELEQEVNNLIQEAIENVEQRESTNEIDEFLDREILQSELEEEEIVLNLTEETNDNELELTELREKSEESEDKAESSDEEIEEIIVYETESEEEEEEEEEVEDTAPTQPQVNGTRHSEEAKFSTGSDTVAENNISEEELSEEELVDEEEDEEEEIIEIEEDEDEEEDYVVNNGSNHVSGESDSES